MHRAWEEHQPSDCDEEPEDHLNCPEEALSRNHYQNALYCPESVQALDKPGSNGTKQLPLLHNPFLLGMSAPIQDLPTTIQTEGNLISSYALSILLEFYCTSKEKSSD